MKPALLLLVGLGTLVAIVVQIGSRLPREHHVTRAVRLPHPPAQVWAAVMKTVSAGSVPVDVVESTPPVRLVTRVKESEKQFGGTWTIIIAPTDNGAALTITEDGWVANSVFRFISRYVIGHYATIDAVIKKVERDLQGQ